MLRAYKTYVPKIYLRILIFITCLILVSCVVLDSMIGDNGKYNLIFKACIMFFSQLFWLLGDLEIFKNIYTKEFRFNEMLKTSEKGKKLIINVLDADTIIRLSWNMSILVLMFLIDFIMGVNYYKNYQMFFVAIIIGWLYFTFEEIEIFILRNINIYTIAFILATFFSGINIGFILGVGMLVKHDIEFGDFLLTALFLGLVPSVFTLFIFLNRKKCLKCIESNWALD